MAKPEHQHRVYISQDIELHEAQRPYRVHKCGLRVGHQHEDVSIQAEFVDPAVQL